MAAPRTHEAVQPVEEIIVTWPIGMPNLGHTMEEGTVSQWLHKVGDTVNKGEVVAVVESDKASFDVESPADGVLLAIHAEAGAVVPIGRVIGEVGAPGQAAAPAPQVAPAAIAPKGPSPPVAQGTATPARRKRASISPAARMLAEELGLDPQDITPSGDDGMITRDDVREHAQRLARGNAPAASPAPQAGTKRRIRPLSSMRRAIAEATQGSWQAVPHVPLHSRADVGALQGRGLNLTAAVARATALALTGHPSFNGRLLEQGLEQETDVNLAIAMSTGDGLVTAVVGQAQALSLAQTQAQIQQLAEGARAGRLDGSRMLGGTFTISSLGRWGVDAFVPIIAAPQVAILGVGRVNRVAREAQGGGVRFASEMGLTLVFDHRANDGVQAAKLLASIVDLLEHPERLEASQ
jgi:pyruvate dehydrogenase E2 component (dihydrolipoamide acetyltransferase)